MDQKRNSSSADGDGNGRLSTFGRVMKSEGMASQLSGDRDNGTRTNLEPGTGTQRIVRELRSVLSDLIEQSELSMAVAGQEMLMCGHLRRIHRSALNALTLMRELPDGVGGHRGLFRTVDIGELVRQSDAGLRMLLPVDATLEIRCPSPIMPARIDPIILEEIMFQFASSSLACIQAPVAIEIEVSEQPSKAGRSPEFAILFICRKVTTPETLSQAYEVDGVEDGLERDSASTMLDISAAADVLSSCGGSPSVDYKPGRRHSLLVTLPKSGDGLQDLPLRDVSGFLPMGTETVLVVQREPATREAVCHIPGAQGYRVLEAASNGEAVDVAGNLEPGELALVVAESVGSIGRGASEGSELRQLPSNVRRLYTTTYVEAGIDASFLADANGAFVDSPFTPRSLVCKVREVLDRDAR